MRRADPDELREDARPALLLSLSEERLRELFPIPFAAVDSEPEPSTGALVRLDSGACAVIVYGMVTSRATVSFPVSANAHDAIDAFLREVPIRTDEILWNVESATRRRAGVR